MSWRTVVISRGAKLDYQMNYLVIRKEEVTKIHLNEIGTLIIEDTAVSLTAYLLCELSKKKIKVIFCDEKRNPMTELIPYYGSHDTSYKIRQQISWSQNIKSLVWTEIVKEKIINQARILKSRNFPEFQLLYSYINEIQINDVTNREGHAAKVYFNSIFGKDFTRGDDCPSNAALNYGYAIILSQINREIVSNGYITQLGLFHDNKQNQFNLSCDLMEPYRPIVDSFVIKQGFEKFGTEEKHEMVKLLNLEVTINERLEFLTNAIKIYVKSVFDALNKNDVSLIRFYEYEL